MKWPEGKRRFPLLLLLALCVAAFIMCFGPAANMSAISRDSPSALSSSSGQIYGYNEQYWHLSRIMAYEAWDITVGKEDVIIAVLDTGIDCTHPALTGKVIADANFTGSPLAIDCHGHGTHIAGIIAGGANQFGQTIGLAHGCMLMNVKVANDDGSVSVEAVAKGIRWAVDNGASVINISLTIEEDCIELEEAVDYAWQQGAIVVAAAGNGYTPWRAYPAAYSAAIAVAATDDKDNLARFSNSGDWVDVSAPGVAIYSSFPKDNWVCKNGTSMAAALVSAEAALLFSLASDIDGNGKVNDEVRQAIQDSCGRFIDESFENGLINVIKAIELLNLPASSALNKAGIYRSYPETSLPWRERLE